MSVGGGSELGLVHEEEPRGNISTAFDLGESLGSGSMTHVRLARRRSNGEEVAVKCCCSYDEEVQRFTREEYRLMCELRHPSIVRVIALYEDPPELWVVMEVCRDGSLESYEQAHGVFSEGQAKALFRQLLDGVNYLHGKRVVHRDLKPANVLLLDSASKLRIADFNSAKRIGASSGSSLMLTDRGTHLYSAPELRFGHLWNERVDIWACGLTLFFMLRASLPFNAESPGVAKVLLSGKLPDIRWDGMDELVANAVQQCLTVNMCDRPPAMELLVHPMFDMEADSCCGQQRPQQRRPSDTRRMSGSECTSRRSEPFIGGEMYVFLPVCGLVPLPGRRAFPGGGRPVVSRSFASTSSGFSQEPCFSRTSSNATGSEESPLPRQAASQRASTARVSGCGDQMLRQLALTKCERTLERQHSSQEDPDSPGRSVARAKVQLQSKNLRRFWTAGEPS